MQLIDNVEGVSLNAAGETTSEKYVKMSDMHIYGMTEGTDSSCLSRMGMQLASLVVRDRALHPLSASAIPVAKIKSIGSWYG